MDPGAYCRLGLTLLPIEVTIASRKVYAPAEVVPEGRNESSPVRSAGLAFRKSDPSRTGRSTGARAREPGCDRPGTQHSDRPWRDGHLLLPRFRAPNALAGLLSAPSGLVLCASAAAGADNADDE